MEPVADTNDAAAALRLLRPADCTALPPISTKYGGHYHPHDGHRPHLLGSAAIEMWLTEGQQTRKVVIFARGDVGSNRPCSRDPNLLGRNT